MPPKTTSVLSANYLQAFALAQHSDNKVKYYLRFLAGLQKKKYVNGIGGL